MQNPNSAALNRRDLIKTAGLGAAATLLPISLGKNLAKSAEMPPPFKYAICNETFVDWPLDRAFAFAAECGYTGVEIAPFTIANCVTDIPAKRRTEVRRLAEQNHLDVVGLHWLLAKTNGLHLTSPDAAVRRKTSEYVGQLARFCAELGGKIMVFGSPQQRNLAPGMSQAEGMKHATEVLQAAMPACEKADVTIALEPLTPAETNFLTTAADGAALMDMVGSPQCRLHLDCKAMASEGSNEKGGAAFYWIPELIHKYRKVFVHFHVNDPNRQGPGFGKLDFVPILKALRDVDYRGWVSVEVFDYAPGIERLARESIEYLKKCSAKLDAGKL
jgi:sugar phosphate isomerase/epimerase